MVRWVSFAAFVALIALGWLFFELTNVWPLNADRIAALRAIFAALAISAVAFFLFARRRLLPAAVLLSAFVVTTALSNAVASIPYIISTGAIVLSGALLSRKFGPSLNVR